LPYRIAKYGSFGHEGVDLKEFDGLMTITTLPNIGVPA
jgi:hypothetical protein